MVRVSYFKPDHAHMLLDRGLRPEDHREAWKVAGLSVKEALLSTVGSSFMTASIFSGSDIVAILGVCPIAVVGNSAAPWLLANKDFERKETAHIMARICKRFIERWLTVYERLENYADPEHEEAIKLLLWLGFSVYPNKAVGPNGHSLSYFLKETLWDEV